MQDFNEEWQKEIHQIISRMLDNPKDGIYPTTKCYDELYAFAVKCYQQGMTQGLDFKQ